MIRNPTLVFALLIFMLISLTTLFSIGKGDNFEKQIIFWMLSLAIFFSSFWIRYNNLAKAPYIWLLVGATLLLLLVNLFLQNKSWLNLGAISFQPSELARLPLLILLAIYLSKFSDRLTSNFYVLGSLLPIAPFLLLVGAQPDFGMIALYFLTWFISILNFVSFKQFLKMSVVVAIIVLIGWFGVLRPYQKERIANFVFPERDPLGSGYNLKQIKIAVGSAGLWGKGYGSGTQAKLGFLPSAQTDFLLASFLEEWGLIGFLIYTTAVFLLLYSLSQENRFHLDPISQSLGIIVLVHFALRFSLTTAVNLGIAPIVGLPTPFLSYGGSHLLTDFLLLSVWRSGRS